MKRLSILLWKEWHDHRGLLGLALILGPVLVALIRWLYLVDFVYADEIVATQVLPGVAAVTLAALAADHFARDSEREVGEGLARLGIRSSTLWLAKMLHLAALAVLVVGWMMAAELLRASVLAGEPAALRAGWNSGKAVLAALCLVAVIVTVSALAVLVRRGLVAALLGALLVVGWFALVLRDGRSLLRLDIRYLFQGYGPGIHFSWFPIWVYMGLALLIGSLVVYRPGRSAVVRRCAGFAVVFALVLGPPAAAVHARYQNLWRGEYGNPITWGADAQSLSPDGRSVLILTKAEGSDWFGRYEGFWRCFVLNVASGEVLHAFETGQFPMFNSETGERWSATGEVCVASFPSAKTSGYHVVDPERGVIAESAERPEGWGPWRYEMRRKLDTRAVVWEGQELEYDERQGPTKGRRPGTFFWRDTEHLLWRTDMASGESRSYPASLAYHGTHRGDSPDLRWLVLTGWIPEVGRIQGVLDLDSGELVAEAPREWRSPLWGSAASGLGGDVLLVMSPPGNRSSSEPIERLMVLNTDYTWREIELEYAATVCASTADGFLVQRAGQLFKVDLDGRDVRRVYPLDETAERNCWIPR